MLRELFRRRPRLPKQRPTPKPRPRYTVRLYGGPAGGRIFTLVGLPDELQVPIAEPLQLRPLLDADDAPTGACIVQMRRAVYRRTGSPTPWDFEQHSLHRMPITYTFDREES